MQWDSDIETLINYVYSLSRENRRNKKTFINN